MVKFHQNTPPADHDRKSAKKVKMELTRWRLNKGFNFNFMTDLQFFQYLFILFGLFNLSVCLFEDQIGKFDWYVTFLISLLKIPILSNVSIPFNFRRQNYVGKLKFSQFDTVSTAKRLIVATEENVVAALQLKTGKRDLIFNDMHYLFTVGHEPWPFNTTLNFVRF